MRQFCHLDSIARSPDAIMHSTSFLKIVATSSDDRIRPCQNWKSSSEELLPTGKRPFNERLGFLATFSSTTAFDRTEKCEASAIFRYSFSGMDLDSNSASRID